MALIAVPAFSTPVVKSVVVTNNYYTIDYRKIIKGRLDELQLTLTQPTTTITHINAINGQEIFLVLIQGTGDNSIVWGGNVEFILPLLLRPAITTKNFVRFRYNKATNKYVGFSLINTPTPAHDFVVIYE